jgi:hypothetical protein
MKPRHTLVQGACGTPGPKVKKITYQSCGPTAIVHRDGPFFCPRLSRFSFANSYITQGGNSAKSLIFFGLCAIDVL